MVSKESVDSPSGDTGNLSKFLDIFSKDQTFNYGELVTDDGTTPSNAAPFEGTFEDMLFHIQSTLGEDQLSTGIVHNNFSITSNELYVNRDGVMGVDLNDEATSLMVYQKAYSSACRLMTVLNEALDSLLSMG